MKKLLLTLPILLVIGGFVFVGSRPTPSVAQKPLHPVVANPVPAPVVYTHDPKIAALFDKLGLDYSHLNLYNTAPPAPNESAIASFRDGNVYITDKALADKPNRITSHEYIHYVQTNLSFAQAQSFYPYMKQLINNDRTLHSRMINYINGTACKGNCLPIEAETEAVACTELSNQRLTPDFVSFCNQWLPKREQTLVLN